MEIAAFLGIPDHIFTWVLVPLLIFLARIVDVSISTLRTMLMMSGRKSISAFIGFFEALVWLLAISQILKNITNPMTYIAYSAGFGMGVYVGLVIEEKLAVGKVLIRIMTVESPDALIQSIRDTGFSVTKVTAEGKKGEVAVLFSVIRRDRVDHITQLIHRHNPQAVYTIETVKFAKDEEEALISPQPTKPSFYKIPLMWMRNRK
jgi:uncharacterized protein YebE (UPF0316 family)